MSTNTKPNPISKQPMTFSGLGLDSMGDLSALLETPIESVSGMPLDLPIALIDEDPDQPRAADNPGFSAKNMAEIAASIRLRGVKTPISVRDHPTMPGRFMVNHGARRLRGSKMADKKTVPGFIDNDYNHVDQFVENLIRDGYSPREIANYIGRELAKGLEQKAIALAISKSPAYVSQHVALLDLPDPIAKVFNEGRVTDVTLVNDLLKIYKKNSQEVKDWLMDENLELTRGTVKEFREYLVQEAKDRADNNTISLILNKANEALPDDQPDSNELPIENKGLNNADIGDSGNDKNLINNDAIVNTKENIKAADPSKIKKAIVVVEHDGRSARIVLDRRSPSSGFAWLKYNDDGEVFMADLSGVKLMEIIEG
jgi:ParB family chromosome partitioning protein